MLNEAKHKILSTEIKLLSTREYLAGTLPTVGRAYVPTVEPTGSSAILQYETMMSVPPAMTCRALLGLTVVRYDDVCENSTRYCTDEPSSSGRKKFSCHCMSQK